MLIKTMDSTVEPTYVPQPNLPAVSRRLADTDRAETLIGFEAEVQLGEGLSRLVDWWRSEQLENERI